MDLLPKEDRAIEVNIEWLHTNLDRPHLTLNPRLMVSHPIGVFVCQFVKDWSFLTDREFVENVENMTVGDGGSRLDLSGINVNPTKKIKYSITYYVVNSQPQEIIDAYKITDIDLRWINLPPVHVINKIFSSPSSAIRLQNIHCNRFFHHSWASIIEKLPTNICYNGVVTTPEDIYMIDYLHRLHRSIVFRATNIEEYNAATAANFITGYNIPIRTGVHEFIHYRSIEDLWASMSTCQKSAWGVLMHMRKK
jgi:hypothetical protein